MLDYSVFRECADAAVARSRNSIPPGQPGGDWHAYKGRPAAPKPPATPPKQPEPSPGAPKPQEPKPSGPPKEASYGRD